MRSASALASVCLGVLLSRSEPAIDLGLDAIVWFSIGCGFLMLSLLVRPLGRSICMLLCLMCIAAGWTQLRIQQQPSHRLNLIVNRLTNAAHSVEQSSIPIEIIGTLETNIQRQIRPSRPADPPTWPKVTVSSQLRIDRLLGVDPATNESHWIKASGIARIILPETVFEHQRILPGDRVRLLGMFKAQGGARNLGDHDWRALANQSQRVGTITVTDHSLIYRLEHVSALAKLRATFILARSSMQSRSLEALGIGRDVARAKSDTEGDLSDEALSLPHRSMLAALLLGHRDPAFGEVFESFQRVGVAHVLSISGFHLALVIMVGVLCVRLVGEYPKAETALVLTVLVGGLILVPLRPPIVRAGVIVAVFVLADRFGRRYDRLTILGWVGVGLLVWRPMDVYSLGYQLSMGITALLLMMSTQSHKATLDRSSFTIAQNQHSTHSKHSILRALLNTLKGSAKTNIACWVVAMPVIMYHAGILSLLAPIVSMVLIPIVTVVMIAGYFQMFLGLLWPAAGDRGIVALDWMAHHMTVGIEAVDRLGFSSLRVGQTDALWTLLVSVFLAVLVTGRISIRHWRTQFIGLGLIVWVSVSLWMMPTLNHRQTPMRIDMLDVGDGTCVIVQSQGVGVLWDCGSLDRRVGRSAVRAARQAGIRDIDDAIITHDNIDHFNGLLEMVQAYDIERVWITRRMIESPSDAWRTFEQSLRLAGVSILEIRANQHITAGNIRLTCLWPDTDDAIWNESLSDNDTSVVARVDLVGSTTSQPIALLTGDIENKAMIQIVNKHPKLNPKIIELPHHGSTKHGAVEFVELLDPQIVMQSTGQSRLDRPAWNSLRSTRVWYASANRGGSWVRVQKDGSITHGWAVE